MKNFLTILLFPLTANSQDTIFFKTGDERSIAYYYVQKSKDTLSWTTIKNPSTGLPQTIAKGKSSYKYVLPKDTSTNYYRVNAIGKALFSTRPILVSKVYGSVSVTNAKISTTAYLDNLSWNAGKEINVSHYLIEKSINNEEYKTVTKVTARGYSKYSTSSSKTGTNRKYKLTVIYKNLSKGQVVSF